MVECRSGILEVRDKAIRFFHDMRNVETAALAARTVLLGEFMDIAARTSAALPAIARERARSFAVPAPPSDV